MEASKFIIDVHQQTARKNVASIYNYVQEGKDVNIRDSDDNTPLHIAAANGSEDIVDILLDYGADTEASNYMGWTPLMQAARGGYKTIVEKLLKFGADVNATNKYGLTALTLASASGQEETVHYILFEIKKQHKYENKFCETNSNELKEPLIFASLFGNHNIVTYLLSEGTDINSSYKIKVSPLHCAAASENAMTMKILLSNGADATLRNFGNYSALNVAAVHYNTEVIEMLKSHKQHCINIDDCVDIFDMIKNGNLTMVKHHLAKNPSSAQIEHENGWTPLMEAAVLNHLPIVQMLLHLGANVNAQDFINGWTPLMQAIFHRNVQVAMFLCDVGANIEIRNRAGYSAFDIAKEVNNSELMQYLLNIQESGPSENLKSNSLPDRSTIKATSEKSRKRESRSSSISESVDKTCMKNNVYLSPAAFQGREDACSPVDYLAYDVEEMTFDSHLHTYLNNRRFSGPAVPDPYRAQQNFDPYIQNVPEKPHYQCFGADASPLLQFNSVETEYDNYADVIKRIETKERERFERQKKYEEEYIAFMMERECSCRVRPKLQESGSDSNSAGERTPPIEREFPGSEYDSIESVVRRLRHRCPESQFCESCKDEIKKMLQRHDYIKIDPSILQNVASRVCHNYPFKYPRNT